MFLEINTEVKEYNESASQNFGEEQSLCFVMDHDELLRDLSFTDHAATFYGGSGVIFSDRSITAGSEDHIYQPKERKTRRFMNKREILVY